jgi:predicted GNAT family acetyltransferase
MLHQYLETPLNLIIGVQMEDMAAAAEAAVDLIMEMLEAVMPLEAAETVVQETLVDLVNQVQTVQAAAVVALENKEQ